MRMSRVVWVMTFVAWPLAGASRPLAGTAQSLLVPMDRVQENHLKAYGLTYWALEQYGEAEWLLNYRGGSFLLPDIEGLRSQAALRGITTERVSGADVAGIRAVIADSNMETVILEKAPSVAIYTPPNSTPWDDAVTMALEYAQIPYETIWDADVLRRGLDGYEWLHLHHEDFTGQYSKFFLTYAGSPWLQEEVSRNEEMAERLGSRVCLTSRRPSPSGSASTWMTAGSCWPCVPPPRPSSSRSVPSTPTSRPRIRTGHRLIRTPRARWNGTLRWPLGMVWCRPASP